MLGKMRSTKQLDYVALIINYFRNRMVGVLEREYMGICTWFRVSLPLKYIIYNYLINLLAVTLSNCLYLLYMFEVFL